MHTKLSKIFINVLFVTLLLTACGSSSSPETNLSEDEIRSTAEALAWISVTQTVVAASIELIPSSTPNPAFTASPIPQPIVLSGTGSSPVEFFWSGPGIAHISHSGAGNFIVESFDINNTSLHVLVNKVGNYDGVVPLNFFDGEQATRFQITADGAWAIAISPITNARTFPLPAVITGTGDEVVMITGIPNTITIDTSQGSGNFSVSALTDFGVELILSEVAPYTETALLNGYTKMLIVTAESNWTLAVNPVQ